MLATRGSWRAPIPLALALLLAPWASIAQGTEILPTECPAPPATERPGSLTDYREGFRLYTIEKWQEGAEAFWASLCRWPEDGETVRVSGRWYLPYIPRYYLGVALNALGCEYAALLSLETSVLRNGPVYRGEDEARHWSTLVSELRAKNLPPAPTGGLCAIWRQRLSQLGTDSPGDFPQAVPITYQHADLRPVRLFELPETGGILIVSHPIPEVYLLERDRGTFHSLGRLGLQETAVDHALVPLATGLAIGSLFRHTSTSGTAWTSFTLTPLHASGLSLGEPTRRTTYRRGFGAVLVRAATAEILFIDRQQESLVVAPLSPEGEPGEARPIPLPSAIRTPTTVTASPDALFIGDGEHRQIFRLSPDQPPTELPGEVQGPFHLAINPSGNRLAVIDVVPGKVLQWRRTNAGDWVPNPLPTTPEISQPTALLFTLDGALLVAQASGKIVEFPAEQKATTRH